MRFHPKHRNGPHFLFVLLAQTVARIHQGVARETGSFLAVPSECISFCSTECAICLHNDIHS
jgi:hypothetical protein